ncbi:putative membrane protein [Cronobacter dublinensis 582]|nr:putative membrane protein [Cronobacter dublinensis 582]
MSVISTPFGARRLVHFWPLALFAVLALAGGVWLWLAWPQVLMKSAVWQRDINREMSALLQQVAQNPTRAGSSLLLFSFVYGVLHALGPGHGKVVIATWLATHPSRLKTSLTLTFASSLLQGLVAITLVTVVLTVRALPARQLHLSGYWLEKGSYLLVGALGLLLCWRACSALREVGADDQTAPAPYTQRDLRLRTSASADAGAARARRRLARAAYGGALHGDAPVLRRADGAAVQQGDRRLWLGGGFGAGDGGGNVPDPLGHRAVCA